MGWREDNVALVERHFRLEEVGDSAAVLDDMVDPPEYVVPALTSGIVATREEISEIHRNLYSAFTPLRVITEQLTVEEDRVAAQVLVGGVHSGEFLGVAPTGKEIYFHVCSVFEIANGKITRESVYSDTGEFIRLAAEPDQ
ncbi:ester cyclase [Streptomyces sp. NBC_00063]|uniref:ester cyclase n=1 Tax=Streptomyces sp. NBC_00063 TaxID=2975638 RepID=UPI003D706A2E